MSQERDRGNILRKDNVVVNDNTGDDISKAQEWTTDEGGEGLCSRWKKKNKDNKIPGGEQVQRIATNRSRD